MAIIRIAFMVVVSMFFCSTSNADGIERWGDAFQKAIPIYAYTLTWIENDKISKKQFGSAFIFNIGTTLTLKKLIVAERPNGTPESFPSGHTSMAFQGASFVHLKHGWRKAWPLYLGACYTGWSRVATDNHYWRDVAAGAALGVLSSYIATRGAFDDFFLSPVATDEKYGIAISIRF